MGESTEPARRACNALRLTTDEHTTSCKKRVRRNEILAVQHLSGSQMGKKHLDELGSLDNPVRRDRFAGGFGPVFPSDLTLFRTLVESVTVPCP